MSAARSDFAFLGALAGVALQVSLSSPARAQPEDPPRDDAVPISPGMGDEPAAVEDKEVKPPSDVRWTKETKPPPRLRPSPAPLADPTGPNQAPPLGAPADHSHAGIFFRAGVGIGGLSASREDTTHRGTGGSLELSVGHSLAQNLLVFIEFRFASAVGPDLVVNGQEQEQTDNDLLSLSATAIGPGATYYLPYNAYVATAITLGWLGFEDYEEMTRSTGLGGFGVKAALGWEWFVSPQWGLGTALSFHYTKYPDPDLGGRWTGTEFWWMLGGTYN